MMLTRVYANDKEITLDSDSPEFRREYDGFDAWRRFNKKMRPGCALFVDGKCIHHGNLSSAAVAAREDAIKKDIELSKTESGARARILSHLRLAASSLLVCWDQLREVEKLVNVEITTDKLGELVSGIDRPEDCQVLITDKAAQKWLGRAVLKAVK